MKFLYRAFKQECPNGIIDEETFKDVYENIFPLGDASKYAHLVFKCIDRGETGNGKYWNLSMFHGNVIVLIVRPPSSIEKENLFIINVHCLFVGL